MMFWETVVSWIAIHEFKIDQRSPSTPTFQILPVQSPAGEISWTALITRQSHQSRWPSKKWARPDLIKQRVYLEKQLIVLAGGSQINRSVQWQTKCSFKRAREPNRLNAMVTQTRLDLEHNATFIWFQSHVPTCDKGMWITIIIIREPQFVTGVRFK